MKPNGKEFSSDAKVPGKVHELNLEKIIFGPMSLEEVQIRTGYVLRAVHFHDELMTTLNDTLQKLENLTTEEYGLGGDKAIRERLLEMIDKVQRSEIN